MRLTGLPFRSTQKSETGSTDPNQRRKYRGHDFDFADHDQDPVAADPFFRPAPEGEPTRIVGVVTEDGPLAAQGVGEMGTLIPVAGEDERARIVEQAELLDPTGHLVPAVEIERGIGPGIDESPAAATVALEPAITILADRQWPESDREKPAQAASSRRVDSGRFSSRARPLAPEDRKERHEPDQAPVRQDRAKTRDGGEDAQRNDRQAEPQPLLIRRDPTPVPTFPDQDDDQRSPDPREQIRRPEPESPPRGNRAAASSSRPRGPPGTRTTPSRGRHSRRVPD